MRSSLLEKCSVPEFDKFIYFVTLSRFMETIKYHNLHGIKKIVFWIGIIGIIIGTIGVIGITIKWLI